MNPKFSAILALSALQTFLSISSVSSVPIKDAVDNNDPNITFQDQSFKKYTQDLFSRFNKRDYFAAIYQDDKTRDEFTKFLNDGLTQQTKDDLSGLRFYKKVGDVEVPVVMFSPQMDSWLGILPQWKRTKRYMFKKMEEFLLLHPEVLSRQQANKVMSQSSIKTVSVTE